MPKGIPDQVHLGEVFVGNYPPPPLVPVQDSGVLSALVEHIVVNSHGASVETNRYHPGVYHLPAAASQTVLGRVHALAGAFLLVERDEQVHRRRAAAVGSR